MELSEKVQTLGADLPNLAALLSKIVKCIAAKQYDQAIMLAKSDSWNANDLKETIEHYPAQLTDELHFDRYTISINAGILTIDFKNGIVVPGNNDAYNCNLYMQIDESGTITQTDVDCPLFDVETNPTDLTLRFCIVGPDFQAKPEYVMVEVV